MSDLTRHTGYVRSHLENYGLDTDGLEISTEPVGNGVYATTLRADGRHRSLTAGYVTELRNILHALPDADVRLRPAVDKIVVVWAGA